jgi:hypothetical protein
MHNTHYQVGSDTLIGCRNGAIIAALNTDGARIRLPRRKLQGFYEAVPHDNRLSDDYLCVCSSEIASESIAWHDSDEFWLCASVGLLAELNWPIFPVTQGEKPIGKRSNKRRLSGWCNKKLEVLLDREPLYQSLRIVFVYSATR